MNITPDGFSPASQSFSPELVKLAGEHGYAGAIERLSRKSYGKPRKPIRRHSAKWSREQRAWNAVVKKRIEEVYMCEVAIPGCMGRATTGHHKLKRSQGGNAKTSDCVVCCLWCHQYIEEHPAWAVENGYTIQRKA